MPVTSEHSEVRVPGVGLYEYLYGSLAPEDEDRTAVIDLAEGTETSFSTLRTHVDSAAGWLARRGIRKGDVIALQCPNSESFIVAAHAVWRLGAVLTPVELLATPRTVAHQITDSGAKLLLTLAGLGDGGEEAAELAGLTADQVVHLDTGRGLNQMYAERNTPPAVDFDPATHLAALPYSAGTTGLPKGVRLTHRNLVANMAQVEGTGLVGRDDVIFGVLPFFHIYGLTVLANLSVRLRATVIAAPRFQLRTFLRSHEDYKVTFSFIAPPVAVSLAKDASVADYDLSALRAVVSGAAPLDDRLARAVEERLGIRVYQGYGLTEASPVTHMNIDDDLSRGSIGRPVAGTSHQIIDPDTRTEILPPTGDALSDAGELWVRGPQIMDGYLGDEEATAAALPGDGWLRTGDIARQDAAGNAYIVDRLKDIIKYKGHQVPPAELEAVLLSHPAVADVAVVGAGTGTAEEIPRAFIVVQPDVTADDALAAELTDYVAAQVEPYKRIRDIRFTAQIPKSTTGKILHHELRED